MFNYACGNLTTVRAWNEREILTKVQNVDLLLDPTGEKKDNRWFS